jgi:hypothetical protein
MAASSDRERLALALLTLGVAAQYAWNAWSLPALAGYDAAGHAGYALFVAREGRLPAPYSGWVSFHPPAWYVAAAGLIRVLEPLGPSALRIGLRAIAALLWVGAGLLLHRALRAAGARPATAWVATALLWLVPVNQLAVAMLGNEAFASAWAAASVVCLLRLQAEPRDARAALGAGIAAGLALASKFTGAWIAAACAVPFARRNLDRGSARALAVCAFAGVAIAGPVMVRNLVLTGTPFPMTRTQHASMQAAETALSLGPRRVRDYLRLPTGCLARPGVHHLPGRPGAWANRNPAMASVPCLAYAGLWYDPFAQRIPIARHRDGEWLGPLLLVLGLVPTALVLAGLALATRDLLRRRGRSADAPLVVMTALAGASFAGFTWAAPSLSAAKASYLMPLAAPAALFFARAADALPLRARALALGLSLAAALASGLVFTSGVGPLPDREHARVEAAVWRGIGRSLPGSKIDEAVALLAEPLPAPPSAPRRPAPAGSPVPGT